MDNQTISAFQATKNVCLSLLKEGFEYKEGGFGNRSCVWEKTINEFNDILQIFVIDTPIGLCEKDGKEPIKFEAHIKIEAVMNIEVVRHGLSFCGFSDSLPRLIDLANKMVGNFHQSKTLSIHNNEHRMAG